VAVFIRLPVQRRHDFEALTARLQGTLVAAGSKTLFALFLIFGNNAIYRRFGELYQAP
jgi:hypothetical protein